MADKDWSVGHVKTLGIFLNGETIPNPNPKGEPRTDDSFFILWNAHYEPLQFIIPEIEARDAWVRELDTSIGWMDDSAPVTAGDVVDVQGRSLAVFRCAQATTVLGNLL